MRHAAPLIVPCEQTLRVVEVRREEEDEKREEGAAENHLPLFLPKGLEDGVEQ